MEREPSCKGAISGKREGRLKLRKSYAALHMIVNRKSADWPTKKGGGVVPRVKGTGRKPAYIPQNHLQSESRLGTDR